MGIRGLTHIALSLKKRKNKNNIIDLNTCKKQIWAIDASLFLYRSRTLCATHTNDHTRTPTRFRNIISDVPLDKSHLVGMIDLICHLTSYGITPFIVFDGEPPPEKLDTINKRRQEKIDFQKKINYVEKCLSYHNENGSVIVTQTDFVDNANNLNNSNNSNNSNNANDNSNDNNEIKVTKKEFEDIKNNIEQHKQQASANFLFPQYIYETQTLCDILGIPYYISQGEAEVTCAILQKNGIVDAVYTADSDVLVLGCTCMVRKIYMYDNVETINSEFIQNELGLTYEQFVLFCIFLGCDFCEGIVTKIKNIKPNDLINMVKIGTTIHDLKYAMGDEWVIKASLAYDLYLQQNNIQPSHDLQRDKLQIQIKTLQHIVYELENKLNLNKNTHFVQRIIQQISTSLNLNTSLQDHCHLISPLNQNQASLLTHYDNIQSTLSVDHWVVGMIDNEIQAYQHDYNNLVPILNITYDLIHYDDLTHLGVIYYIQQKND
jgi:5'-3' exonuclease